MKDRYIVRDYAKTPIKRINKEKSNVFYFKVYDKIEQKIILTIFDLE